VLDARMKEPDMLAVREHPQAWFVADRFEFDSAGSASGLRGELTLRGTSLPLQLKAQRFNCYTSPLLKVEMCGGDFEGSLVRSAAGITHSLPLVSDTVRLLVQVEAVRGAEWNPAPQRTPRQSPTSLCCAPILSG
jgi:polyisoprenoid-binding protein YceI